MQRPIKTKLNLFYQEPEFDRWFKYDRYPRKIIRKIFRPSPRPGGQMMVAINLMKGLDKLDISYRFNDFRYSSRNPNELIGVIGKPHLIFENKFKNPVLFGASIFSHPIDCPTLLNLYPKIQKILVPGPWIKAAFDQYYGEGNVISWPTGIDTYQWNRSIKNETPEFDFLIYDKVRWEHDKLENEFINPIINILKDLHLTFETIRYGLYTPKELKEKLARCKAVIFLCEHETQGIAYQQILATNTPILAWDRESYWLDPAYYPERVKYQPVTAVPYWDENCGEKFKNLSEFPEKLNVFLLNREKYLAENYILENLTLEKCAQAYVDIYHQTAANLDG